MCPINNCLAQKDSMDFIFSSAEPILMSKSDSLNFHREVYKEYHLQFHISNLARVERVWIEVTHLGNKSIILHKSFTKKQLTQAGYLDKGEVNISLGNLLIANYQIHVRLEDVKGNYGRVFTKTIIAP